MRFAKMHGLGNDYLFLDGRTRRIPRISRLARAACDRRFGVGADGVVVVSKSSRADFRMTMVNPDGSEAEMCGNGIRCLGKYVYDRKLTRKRKIRIDTRAGIKVLDLHLRGGRVHSVTVDMGEPAAVPDRFHRMADGHSRMVPVKVDVNGTAFDARVLSQGNPHCVIFVKDARTFPVDVYGPTIERHPDFPSRTNVEFVSWISSKRLFQRTWERGVGETWACGTGACAVATTQFLPGKVKGRLRIDLRGGPLDLSMKDGHIFMTGPAELVCEGELSPSLLK